MGLWEFRENRMPRKGVRLSVSLLRSDASESRNGDDPHDSVDANGEDPGHDTGDGLHNGSFQEVFTVHIALCLFRENRNTL